MRGVGCVATAASVALAGCGGSSRPTACLDSARKVIAGYLGAPPKQVSTRPSTGGNSMPQCGYAARGVQITANVDSAPQA